MSWSNAMRYLGDVEEGTMRTQAKLDKDDDSLGEIKRAARWSETIQEGQYRQLLLFSRSVVSYPLRPHGPRQASLSFTISWTLPKLMSIDSVMPSNHLILCHPILLPPSIFPSIRVFSSESVLHIRWPKYWSFSFNISPSNEYSGLIFFRMDWLDLLAVQGTLKCLHHSSKASVVWHSSFFIVQTTYWYMTTGKTIALTRQTFVGNVSAF